MIEQIPLHLIDGPPVRLRPVITDTQDFADLKYTMNERGLDNSILARRVANRYQVPDGGHRVEAARQLGWDTIPGIIREMSDLDMLVVQFTNVIRISDKDTKYTEHLLRIQRELPDINAPAMSRLVGKSVTWVKNQLKLSELHKSAERLLNAGKLKISNAYVLAKLPTHMQERYLPIATTSPNSEFKKIIREVLVKLQVDSKDRTAEARLAANEFKPHFIFRPFKQVEKERKNKTEGANIIAESQPTTMLEAFQLGIDWVCSMDPITLSIRRTKFVKDQLGE